MEKYWNLRKTLTYNRLINVIVGNRGGGKSYGAKQWCIDNFIKKREQFAYVRRYRDDLKHAIPTFFKDIQARYPDYQFKVEGSKFYIRLTPVDSKTKWSDEDVAGYGFILSTANNLKSTPYPNITTIIYDEFLIDKGNQRYLPNEPVALLNLYETIARPGTEHPRVRLFMLANAITITNPYFMYWDLKLSNIQDRNKKYIWLHPTRPILVEDVRNEVFISEKKKSEFGQLISGTSYEDFSVENKFILDDDTFVERKGNNARYYFTFIYKDVSFGVWADFNKGKLWVSNDIDPSYLITYTLTVDDHKPNTLLLKTAGKRTHFRIFIDAYKDGKVYFESINIKNLTYEVIKMLLN